MIGACRRRILVVDDERACREGLRGLLTAEGYAVETAADGLEAIRRVTQEQFAVAIVDLRLPVLTGWDVIRVARAHDPTVGVIVMTADPGALASARSQGVEVDGCLEKPISWTELKSLLRVLVTDPCQVQVLSAAGVALCLPAAP